MIFYGYFRSSAAYRCRIAFNLKGVTPDFVPVHLRKGEQKGEAFTALNPQGMVPALAVEGGLLTQSLAILEWLDETIPEPAFLPKDALARAQVRAMAQTIACDIHPLQNLRVLNYLRQHYGQDQAGCDAWCREWIESGLAALETVVARSGTAGRFCHGDAPGLADICLVPQMVSAARFGADVSGLTHLNRIMANCEALLAFANAHPSRQPDAEA